MKTLKQQYEELNKAIIDAILSGEFDTDRIDENRLFMNVGGLKMPFWMSGFAYHMDTKTGTSDYELKMTEDEQSMIYDMLKPIFNSLKNDYMIKKIESLRREADKIEQSLK